ncbi:MAG: protoglobin domain-containing protein [Acidimicrobiia bacterium]
MARSDEQRTWPGRDDGLSERESQVLVLCADGLTNQQIADALFLSVETVKTHLRKIYARLGLNGRVGLVSYLHTSGAIIEAIDRSQPPRATRPRRSGGKGPEVRPLVDALGIDEQGIARRRALAGLTDEMRPGLAALAPATAEIDDFTDLLYERLGDFRGTAGYVDEQSTHRLRHAHGGYIADLFTSPYDTAHIETMLQLGATLHDIRLRPQWFVATYAYVLTFAVDVIAAACDDRQSALEAIATIAQSAFFDIGLQLEGAAAKTSAAVEEGTAPAEIHRAPIAITAEKWPSQIRHIATRSRRLVTRSPQTSVCLAERSAFLGIDATDERALAEAATTLLPALHAAETNFRTFLEDATAASLLDVRPDAIAAWIGSVTRFWTGIIAPASPEDQVAGAVRLGMICDRIGLPPEVYLSAAVRQLPLLMRALAPGQADITTTAKALIRGLVLSATFLLDAYYDEHTNSLIQNGSFAEMAQTTATGIVIIDAADRVEYANDRLISLLRTTKRTELRRMKVHEALPIPGLSEFVAEARRTPHRTTSHVQPFADKLLHISAMRMSNWFPVRDGIAIVIEDISAPVASLERTLTDAKLLSRAVELIDAAAWEADATTSRLLASTPSLDGLLGERDIDLVATRGIVEFVHPDDLGAFKDAWERAALGNRHRLRHRWQRADGSVVTTDTVMSASGTAAVPKISGISIPVS